MFKIVSITPENASDFHPLTFSKLRSSLGDPANSVLAFGAVRADCPVGLIVSTLTGDQNARVSNVLSLAVAREHRRLGIGRMLLNTLEQTLAQEGVERVSLTYLGDSPARSGLEALLDKAGWEVARPQTALFRGDIRKAVSLPWVKRSYLPPCYHFSAWLDVSPVERELIKSGSNQRLLYEDDLSPFHQEETIERNSIALRLDGEIVGWQITHRVLPDTLKYSRMFVRSDLKGWARGAAVVAEALRRHFQDPTLRELPRSMFHVGADNHDMLRFVERRLAPCITSATMNYRASKVLLTGRMAT